MSSPDPRVNGMSMEFLTCREGGHVFPWADARRERIREYGVDYHRTTRTCACCKSVRIDLYRSSTLELVSRRYELADGYASPPGQGRIERGSVRRELLGRVFGEDFDDFGKKDGR